MENSYNYNKNITGTKPFMILPDLYATPQKRFLNFFIDYLVRFLLVSLYYSLKSILFNGGDFYFYGSLYDVDYKFFPSIVMVLIYYTIAEGLIGTTVGKAVTKTVVIDKNGEKPPLKTIFIRSLCRLIPFDAFSFFGTPSRGWHDSLSETYVVDANKLQDIQADVLTKEYNKPYRGTIIP